MVQDTSAEVPADGSSDTAACGMGAALLERLVREKVVRDLANLRRAVRRTGLAQPVEGSGPAGLIPETMFDGR